MKLSELYGKICESDGGKSGYVISVCVSGDKIECLICADEQEKEFTVDAVNLIEIGEKIVYEDREQAMKSAKPVRLGNPAFDESGKFLGSVDDFDFARGKLISAKIGKKKFPAAELALGDAVIVKRKTVLKYDVFSEGKIFLKKGTQINKKVLAAAKDAGEYVQTSLKSI